MNIKIRSLIVNIKIKFLEQTCSHVAEWALSYRATEFDAIHTLCILLGTFNMVVGRGEVPIIPVIFVQHRLLLSPETLSLPRASIDLVAYMAYTL